LGRSSLRSSAVKKNLNREERQGFANDAKQVLSTTTGVGQTGALPLVCGCARLLSAGSLPGVMLHNFKVAARTVWRAPSQGTLFLPPETPLSARTAGFRAISPDASNAASRDRRCTPPRTAARANDRRPGSTQYRCARDRRAPGYCGHDA